MQETHVEDTTPAGQSPMVIEPEPDKTAEEIPSEYTLENGATLKISKPSAMLLASVMTRVEEENPIPEIPEVWMEDKGRNEANPNDPGYRAKMAIWNANAVVRMFKALCASSLSIQDLGDAYDPNGEDFADYLDALDLEVAPGKTTRFLQWLNTYALVQSESKKLNSWMMTLAGVTEADVAEATDFLQGDKGRPADPDGKD